MVDIVIPSLGESVSEAVIVRWMKQKGDFVKIDDPLLELETDKVTLEINSPGSGLLSSLLFQVDDTVEVGQIIGTIDVSVDIDSKLAVQENDINVNNVSSKKGLEGAVKHLSPSAAKISRENKLDGSILSGTGKDGRITKKDVLDHLNKTSSSIAEPNPIVSSDTNSSDLNINIEKHVKMSRLRQRIAKRLKDAQNTAAILTTFNEVDMSSIISIRSKIKDTFEKKHSSKLGFMSFFIKACIVALKEIPEVNAEIKNNHLIYKNYYDIGVAVGTESGLVVPVLRGANNMNFAEIEQEILNLALKAREGNLSVSELSGGTFTISNGGVYGSLLSTPILNPPQSGILGMHKIQKRAVVVDNKLEIRPMMYLALSYDHRIIDGKGAVSFLIRVKECLENPERILLEV